MSQFRSLRCQGIALAIFLAAANVSLQAEQFIIVTQTVAAPYPGRSVPFGVAPRGPDVTTPVKSSPAPTGIDAILAWNNTTIETEVEANAMMAKFNFAFTNISQGPITITGVSTSCGCTAAHLPDLPKTFAPGDASSFEVDMNVSGKRGRVEKVVTLATDKGAKQLFVISNIKPEMTGMSESERRQNLEMAIADRQAVFRDDCARCHATPAKNKMGKELFAATCAICHESDHRASMVPDLHNLPYETSAAFWSTWITYGKPNSLMPAFSQSQGGILTQEQITSLVDYLVEAIPPKPAASFANKTN